MASSILYSTSASVIALPSGINRCVVVSIANATDSAYPVASFNGEAMIPSSQSVRTIDLSSQVVYLPTNLSAGNYNLTFSGGTVTGFYAYVLDHVDQVNPVSTSGSSSNNAVGSGAVTINCTSGEMEITALATGTGDGTQPFAPGTNLTRDAVGSKWASGHNSSDLTGSQTFTWDWASTRSYAMSLAAFRVADTDYYGAILSSTWIM